MKAKGTGLLLDRIETLAPSLTRSQRLIAAFLTANVRDLALENAASVAHKAQVSPMTVGRFLRTLGYASFDEIRREASGLRAPSSLHVGERYARFARGRRSAAPSSASFDAEVNALIGTYQLASGPRWNRLVRRLASAREVHVAGFQTVRGVAKDFAARLEYVRDGVRFADGANGTYAELFAGDPRITRCVLLIDIRRYAMQAKLLAEAASQRKVPIAIVTDAYCHWARAYTADVLNVQTDVSLFWDSNAAITSLLNLLLNGVIGHLGQGVGERARRLEDLQARFGAFIE